MLRSVRGLLLCGAAGVMLASACQPAPAASPTPAPAKPAVAAAEPTKPAAPAAASPPPAASPSPSPAAAGPPNVVGPVDSIDGRTLMVATTTGPKAVMVPESAKIEQEGKGAVADLKPGLSVGVTGKPDGTAVSIRIFPVVLGTPSPGQRPMAGPQQGNLMTNALIDSFDGTTLMITAAGTKYTIKVVPETEVLKPLPATFADIATGKRVLAAGTPNAEGVLQATSVNVLGPPPPMAP